MNIAVIKETFQVLMGMNGDVFAKEIITTGVLSARSYDIISDNVYYNGKDSIDQYFGLVQWYYFEGKRAAALEKARLATIIDKM